MSPKYLERCGLSACIYTNLRGNITIFTLEGGGGRERRGEGRRIRCEINWAIRPLGVTVKSGFAGRFCIHHTLAEVSCSPCFFLKCFLSWNRLGFFQQDKGIFCHFNSWCQHLLYSSCMLLSEATNQRLRGHWQLTLKVWKFPANIRKLSGVICMCWYALIVLNIQ